jgi:hypothetical protein
MGSAEVRPAFEVLAGGPHVIAKAIELEGLLASRETSVESTRDGSR